MTDFDVDEQGNPVTDWLVRATAALTLMFAVSGNSLAGEEATVRETSLWLGDYSQARRVARESDKPLFVVFRCQH
jgi:hypothetical protein